MISRSIVITLIKCGRI